jgi:hypothetical protein
MQFAGRSGEAQTLGGDLEGWQRLKRWQAAAHSGHFSRDHYSQ